MDTKQSMEAAREMPLTQDNSPAAMIREAVKGKADLEKLKGLLDLQIAWEANEARKEYHVAMAKFKQNPPTICKEKTVAYGNTKYNYATLANVVEKISSELSKHGLSASWQTKTNGVISVTCRITHVKGHSEETTLSADADLSGSKNKIQAIGSTISYLERYTILALTGLATEDMDDDAQSVTEFIDDKQKSQIIDMLDALPAPHGPFLKYMGVESFDRLPKAKFQQAIEAIKSKSAKKAGVK
jgi:hypothetical protein